MGPAPLASMRRYWLMKRAFKTGQLGGWGTVAPAFLAGGADSVEFEFVINRDKAGVGGDFLLEADHGFGRRQVLDTTAVPADEKVARLTRHVEHEVTDLAGKIDLTHEVDFAKKH